MSKYHAALFAMTVSMLALSPAHADTSSKKIAFSNNYAGNTWRQAMLASWNDVTPKAVADGIVAAADVFTTAENQATEQAAQIQNLVLQGYDAIVINAASPTALNGAIKEACDAGVVVVTFDGIATEPCAWRVTVDFKEIGYRQVKFLNDVHPEGGNLLEVRGLPGTSIDSQYHEGILAGVKDFPKFKVVREVQGDWSPTVAQKAVASVLPSLPEIVGVVTQGEVGFGTAEAFKAAGRPIPTVFFGNSQAELAWWKENIDKNGYKSLSGSIPPGMSSMAFWVAQQILDGKKDIPKDLTVPFLGIDAAGLDTALASTPEGGVANINYTQDIAIEAIAAASNQ
jgi:ribose transport system substrate-binding protein|nr:MULTISPECIES: ABC transporter substrate-binding protein [unclassified Rhizobium]